jgi:hypothetical protein
MLDARLIKASDADFKETNKALTQVIFGDKKQVKMTELNDLVASIKEELYHYEFHTFASFDEETKSISVEDFLKSIVSCISGSK